MSVTDLFDTLPTGAIIVGGLVLAALAVRFRKAFALALAAVAAYGQWRAGDASFWIPVAMGVLAYAILETLAGLFSPVPPRDGVVSRYDSDADWRRANDTYQRITRENRFR